MNRKAILVAGILYVLVPSVTQACDPSQGDRWFLESIHVDDATLPEEIEVIQQYDRVFLKNDSDVPFYILRSQSPVPHWGDFPKSELPEGYAPRHKLVSGKAYYYLSPPDVRPEDAGWNLNGGGINDSASRQVEVSSLVRAESQNVSADNRPEDAPIPVPSEFAIYAYFKSAPMTIQGEIAYELNVDYDPALNARGAEECAEWVQGLSR